jgi:hypothetical protein
MDEANPFSGPVELPFDGVLDLHMFAPRDAKAAVEAFLEEARRRHTLALRIIHGKGTGFQRAMVAKLLSETPFVKSYADAPMEAGGWGATIVTLFNEEEKMPLSHPATRPAAGLITEYDLVLANAGEILGGLGRHQFNWSPFPGTWSVGQCLDHLICVDRMYAEKIAQAVEQGRDQSRFGEPPFRYGAIESYFLRATEPPPKLRVKAPKTFVPNSAGNLDPLRSLEDFREVNRRLARLVEEADGLDWVQVKVTSPILRFWKWSLGIVLAVAVAHDRRHLYQARRVIESPGFPNQ